MRNGPLLTGALVAGTAFLTMTPPAHPVEGSALGFMGARVADYSFRGDIEDGSERTKLGLDIVDGSLGFGFQAIELESMVKPEDPLPGQENATFEWDSDIPRQGSEPSQRVFKWDSNKWDLQIRAEYNDGFEDNVDDAFGIGVGNIGFKKPPVDNGEGSVRIDEMRVKGKFKVLGKNFDSYKGNASWKAKGVIEGGPNDGKGFKVKIKLKVKKAPRVG